MGAGGRTGTGTTQVGQTSPFGKYLGNPIAAGLAASRTSPAGMYQRTLPFPVSFGTPVFDTATLTRTQNLGTTTLGGLGGLGGAAGLGGLNTGQANAMRFAGASSAGIRRAPGYLTEPVFELPTRPAVETVRTDLQGVIARTSRLPSRDSIRVSSDGETIVLRGQVRDEREKRLAEAVLRLSPGVRAVRNELEFPQEAPKR